MRTSEIPFQPQTQSLMVDASGKPKKKKVNLPSSIKGCKPESKPNEKVKENLWVSLHMLQSWIMCFN